MAKQPDFDLAAAHRYFAAGCFNRAWDFIEKAERTPQEADLMLQLSMTSLWHWTQRDDCTAQNLSIGNWQISRVYALLGQADNARHYGELSLKSAQEEGVEAFCEGFGYEALARAELVAGNRNAMTAYLSQAKAVAETVTDPQDKELLMKDLATLG